MADLAPLQLDPPVTDWDQTARDRFGVPSLHPWQREAVEELVEGRRRVLVVAPTGGGKSMTYQLPATVLEGTTLVVSPLIALMEDQVRGLRARGIAATWLSSTVPSGERRARTRALLDGEYRLVYLAPERLSGWMIDKLAELGPPLVAIDEAHCISEWGHDFRPDYLRLREVLERLAPAHVLACTATATPRVREEIVAQLGLSPDETRVVLRGFARPNLHLAVEEVDSPRTRREIALATLKQALGTPTDPQGAAIVYAATRRNTEKIAEAVAQKGWRTAAYHGGMEAGDRAEVNRRFADRDLDVVVATNAFGMGIDRADIRAVIHVQTPGSIEAYYQEVGRAGRDGQPAHGLLLGGYADMGLRRRLIDMGVDPQDPEARDNADRQWKLYLDLWRYVEAGSCRHDFILSYFGDERETLGGCGHCDVCERLETLGADASVDDETTAEATTLVRKALAGVARNRGTAGLQAVADMLVGSDNAKLERWGLTRLSTHGLLSDRPKAWVMALLRRLVTAGLVEITGDDYPKPYLTDHGVAVMKDEAPCRVLLPDDDAGKPRRGRDRKRRRPAAQRADLAETDRPLFDRLRDARLEIARSRGVPAYVICHDRTLEEIATRRPTSLDELGEVHGMGPARLEAYGDSLLEVVQGDAGG